MYTTGIEDTLRISAKHPKSTCKHVLTNSTISFLSITDEVTRDYLPGVTDPLHRKVRLLPWQPEDMTHLSYEQHEYEESFYSVRYLVIHGVEFHF